jgi:hypothetical protein
MHVTMEELLEVVLSVQSVSRCYKYDESMKSWLASRELLWLRHGGSSGTQRRATSATRRLYHKIGEFGD